MFEKRETRPGLLLFAADMGLTLLALYLAIDIWQALPFGSVFDEALSLSLWHYGLVFLIWAFVFIELRIYDISRALRFPDGAQEVLVAGISAILILAGVNYFFFPEFSRVLFLYFSSLDLLFLLASRLFLQGMLRLGWLQHLSNAHPILSVGSDQLDWRTPINGVARVSKRLFDLVVCLFVLPPATLIMAVAALLIKLDTPGPVFFVQKRIGERGKPFLMVKLRTMVEGAELQERSRIKIGQDGFPVLAKQTYDPRVTRVGRLLRRFSIDELPQLFNVLKGDMSLVGPRPELPYLVEQYQPWHHQRLSVPQGMTGWWQVNGRNKKPEQQLRIEDDLYYIYNYSLWLDILILLRTSWAVFKGEGAY
jgi:lipopolysaccharide/colanic/teichoic acid biosynthesis glycosyltransferase